MTDVKKFNDQIELLGITISELSRRAHVSRKRIYALKSGAEASASEIVGLSKALLLDDLQRDAIFLAPECE